MKFGMYLKNSDDIHFIRNICYGDGCDWRIVSPSDGMFNLVLRLRMTAAGVVELVVTSATVVPRRRPLTVVVAGVVDVLLTMLLDTVESGRDDGSEC